MDWTLEVVVLPVSGIDRWVAFYRDQVGFRLDHDTRNSHRRARAARSSSATYRRRRRWTGACR